MKSVEYLEVLLHMFEIRGSPRTTEDVRLVMYMEW